MTTSKASLHISQSNTDECFSETFSQRIQIKSCIAQEHEMMRRCYHHKGPNWVIWIKYIDKDYKPSHNADDCVFQFIQKPIHTDQIHKVCKLSHNADDGISVYTKTDLYGSNIQSKVVNFLTMLMTVYFSLNRKENIKHTWSMWKLSISIEKFKTTQYSIKTVDNNNK